MARKSSSPAWDYFRKDPENEDRAICKVVVGGKPCGELRASLSKFELELELAQTFWKVRAWAWACSEALKKSELELKPEAQHQKLELSSKLEKLDTPWCSECFSCVENNSYIFIHSVIILKQCTTWQLVLQRLKAIFLDIFRWNCVKTLEHLHYTMFFDQVCRKVT